MLPLFGECFENDGLRVRTVCQSGGELHRAELGWFEIAQGTDATVIAWVTQPGVGALAGAAGLAGGAAGLGARGGGGAAARGAAGAGRLAGRLLTEGLAAAGLLAAGLLAAGLLD